MNRATARQAARRGRDDDEWMLKKAEAISEFLAQQRNRNQKTAAKSAWGVALKQLSSEGELLHRQLQQLLQQGAIRTPELAGELLELQQQHEQLESDSQTERLQGLAQVQDLSRLIRSMRCYGLSAIEQLEATVDSLQQEIRWLGQDLQSNITTLAAEAEQLSQEIAADSKAAIAAEGGTSTCDRSASQPEAVQPVGAPDADEDGFHSSRDSRTCATDSNQDANMFITAVPATDRVNAEVNRAASSVYTATAAADQDLQQLLSRYPLAADRLKQQVFEAFNALHQQHQQQVQQLTTAGQPGTGEGAKFGGWSADDHALFVRLRGLAFKSASSSGRSGASGGKGCSRAGVLERLSLMMPGKAKKDIERHDTWYIANNLHQRRLADLATAWQRQRSSFLTDSEQMLQEAEAASFEAVEAAAAKLEWEAAGKALHDKLEDMQVVKEQNLKELAQQLETEAAAAAATAAEQQAAWIEQREAKKAQIAQYRDQQQEQQAAVQLAEEQAAAEARAAAEAAMDAQKPAVAARQAMAWDKMQQQIEQQKQRQVELEARQKRLAALAEAFAPHVDRDPQRLLQATAASAAAVEAGAQEVQDAAGAAFRPVHGYNTAQVVADPRFRVVEALRDAGLTGGAAKGYVQQVFSGMQSDTAGRRGNLTTGQLEALQARN